ncbi:MAG: iron-sulfur cluster assembly scaffold protein [Chloroflexi bacterium]|nr:iron-sulfur cluster assembly scaffold protein [Chloroflexota bacterium]
MPFYSPLVQEHLRNPRNVGEMPGADAIGVDENPICGDVTWLWVKIQGDLIARVTFKTRGCPAAVATSSACTEMVTGMPLATARRLTAANLAQAVGGLPPAKVHCSVLAIGALHKALAAYERARHPGS